MLNKLPLEKIALTILLIGYLARWAFYGSEPIEINNQTAPYTEGANAAVFAAYSADGTVSDYVVDYLKKLKEIAPNIIYVTDNPIKRGEIKKISPYITHLIAYRHGEYDWGSYKRGVNLIKTAGTFDKLILANDSTLPLAASFRPILEKMQQSEADIYGITANTDGTYHLQSYFLILSKKAWQNPAFSAYLNAVKPEKDGLTVAYRYEVPFTEYMENNGFKSAAHIPYETLSALPLNDKNCYPLTMVKEHHAPFLKMRTFTNRLNVQESRRLLFNWLKQNKPAAYKLLIAHLQKINSPYLKDNRE